MNIINIYNNTYINRAHPGHLNVHQTNQLHKTIKFIKIILKTNNYNLQTLLNDDLVHETLTDMNDKNYCNELKKQAINEFIYKKDILRYLRARDFNIKKTLKMFIENIKWRSDFIDKEYKISEFRVIGEFHKNGGFYHCGKDKDGRPVIILKAKVLFPRLIEDTMDVVYFFVYYMERFVQYTEQCGFTEFTAIADLEGFSVRQNFSLSMSKVLANLLQNHYPERYF